jgi:hypothetical protein
MYLAKMDDLRRYPSPNVERISAHSLRNGTTNGQFEELIAEHQIASLFLPVNAENITVRFQ